MTHKAKKRKVKNKKSNSIYASLDAQKIKRKRFYIFLMIFGLVLSMAGLFMIKSFVGYASFAGKGGVIYELDLYYEGEADYWAGLYGIALGFVGFHETWYQDAIGNQIDRGIFIFDCVPQGDLTEVYASLVNSSDIDWNTIQAATQDDIDTFLGIDSSNYFSAHNMFTELINITVGNVTIEVPATYTIILDSPNSSRYDLGIMKDGLGNIIMVTHNYYYPEPCYRGSACNIQMLLPVRNGSSGLETYYFFPDPNDVCVADEGPQPENRSWITGNITDSETGASIEDVIVVIAGNMNLSDENGTYFVGFEPGIYYLFAIKENYSTYYNILNVSQNNVTYSHNILLSKTPNASDINSNIDPNPGDKTEDESNPEEKTADPIIERPQIIVEYPYFLAISEITRKIRQENFVQELLHFINRVNRTIDLGFEISGEAADIIEMSANSISLSPTSSEVLTMTIFGKGEPRTVTGILNITGEIDNQIPIYIEILDKALLPVEALLMTITLYDRSVITNSEIRFRVDLQNLLTDQQYPVKLTYNIQNMNGTKTYWSLVENTPLLTKSTIHKNVPLTDDMVPGEYILTVSTEYLGLASASSAFFVIRDSWYNYKLFGVLPLWILFLIILALILGLSVFFYLKKRALSKKKYKMAVDFEDTPKEGEHSLFVGKFAETTKRSYFDMNQFKMHAIIAGSTGSGKSFSTQSIVEELLDKNVAILAFDPTAQWTGMLRKAKDKGILGLYKNFGMKKSEAKAYPGGIRQITNAYEEIELAKYIKPGEIQVFAINKLDPADIEVFVSNTIQQIFHQGLQEQKDLRLVLVYDEVHRLLPKFGGSGIGFMQLERGLREFRKWGLGILMISQVLNDFVDAMKANISTQIQMKSRDEGELEAVRMKYGKEVYRALIKTKIGTGLVINADYNHGVPYFIEFRPIKHALTRLTDEEIEKYDVYNKKIDQIEYEVKQLEELKFDTFNIKLEVNLLQKKLKDGSFQVVDIYLEEVLSELEKAWQKLKKKPKQMEIKLIDRKQVEEEIRRAKEDRAMKLAKLQEKQRREGKEVVETPKDENSSASEFVKTVPLKDALNFDNGATVMSLEEMHDVLASMTDDMYIKHIKPGIIHEWISGKLNQKGIAEKIKVAESRQAVVDILDSFREQSAWFEDSNKNMQAKITEEVTAEKSGNQTEEKSEAKSNEQAVTELSKPNLTVTPEDKAKIAENEEKKKESGGEESDIKESDIKEDDSKPKDENKDKK